MNETNKLVYLICWSITAIVFTFALGETRGLQFSTLAAIVFGFYFTITTLEEAEQK